jgi:hypothetical protein
VNRRSFFRNTAGALAVAVVPAWAKAVEAAPVKTKAIDVPSGTRWRDGTGNEYVYARHTGAVAIGSFCVLDASWQATPLTGAASGRVGVSTANAKPGDYGWLMVHGQTDVKAMSYPYAIDGRVMGMRAK